MIVCLVKENVESYLDGIARVHYGAYSKEHFTSCFDSARLKIYYRYLIENGNLSVVHLDGHGDVDGFIVAGPTVGHGVSQFIGSHRLYLIGVMLRYPRFLIEKARFYLRSRFSNEVQSEPVARFRLMSIAVNAKTHSKGIGTSMIRFFEEKLTDLSVPIYGLSVRKDNSRAIAFYRRMGFLLEKETRDSLYFYKEIKADE